MSDSYNRTLYQLEAEVKELQRNVNKLSDQLKQTQMALNTALDALGRLGETIDVRVGSEPAPYLKDWKMRPIDE